MAITQKAKNLNTSSGQANKWFLDHAVIKRFNSRATFSKLRVSFFFAFHNANTDDDTQNQVDCCEKQVNKTVGNYCFEFMH